MFHFDGHLFDIRNPSLEYFVLTFAQLAREGLGPSRGRADLICVDQLDLEGETLARVFDGGRFQMGALAAPASVDLNAQDGPTERVRVRFVTPTELKEGQQVVDRPEFRVLFGRLRDRISTLRLLYGGGPLEIDFRAMGERAATVRMVRCELERVKAERLSSRTGQRHALGGFVGEVEYEGPLDEFMPYLQLGRWVGVGRQTVWGKGELAAIV